MMKLKNKLGFLLLTVLLAGLGLFPVLAVEAASVGISPSEMEAEVLIGTTRELYFNLSRSESIGETRFDIVVGEGGEEFLDIGDQKELIIPDGENLIPFYFKIDATNLELGDYETKISFILKNIADSSIGNPVRYGVTGKLKFAVVESWTGEPPAIDFSRAENKTELVSLESFSSSFEQKTGLFEAVWRLKNLSDAKLINTGLDMKVFCGQQEILSRYVSVPSPFESEEVREIKQQDNFRKSAAGKLPYFGFCSVKTIFNGQELKTNFLYFSELGLTIIKIGFLVFLLIVAIVLFAFEVFKKKKKFGKKNAKKIKR